MVRAEVAGQKIARAEAWLREVEDLLAVSAEQLATDGRRADLASFYLFLAIQEAMRRRGSRSGAFSAPWP